MKKNKFHSKLKYLLLACTFLVFSNAEVFSQNNEAPFTIFGRSIKPSGKKIYSKFRENKDEKRWLDLYEEWTDQTYTHYSFEASEEMTEGFPYSRKITKSMFYLSDVDLERITTDEREFGGISAKGRYGAFIYFKADKYAYTTTYSQAENYCIEDYSTRFEIILATKADVDKWIASLKEAVFNASLGLDADETRPDTDQLMTFNKENPNGISMAKKMGKIEENAQNQTNKPENTTTANSGKNTLHETIKTKGGRIEMKGKTCYKYDNKFYDSNFIEIGSWYGDKYRFNGTEMYEKRNDVLFKGNVPLAYGKEMDGDNSYMEASRKTLYLSKAKGVLYKGKTQIATYTQVSQMHSSFNIFDMIVLADYLGL